MIIEGERIILKEFTDEHLNDPNYFGWLRDIEIVKWIYRVEYLMPLSFITVKTYVDYVTSSGSDCLFAIHERSSGDFIGTHRIGHINWRTGIADMGIMIGIPHMRGKGYSVETMRLGIYYSFRTLGLRRLTAGTPSENYPMRRCLDRLGFVEEGCLRRHLLINGEWMDHILYGIFKEDWINV